MVRLALISMVSRLVPPRQECVLGCFIISLFLDLKNPGVSVGGVLGKNPTHESLALCDVIKMWCKAVEVLRPTFQLFGISCKPLS